MIKFIAYFLFTPVGRIGLLEMVFFTKLHTLAIILSI